jgi:hypothetical protein
MVAAEAAAKVEVEVDDKHASSVMTEEDLAVAVAVLEVKVEQEVLGEWEEAVLLESTVTIQIREHKFKILQ